MKKFFLILFLLLLISAIVVSVQLFRDGYGKTILTLNSGTMLEVDDTWESGDMFLYEVDGNQYLIDKNDVKSIGKADQEYSEVEYVKGLENPTEGSKNIVRWLVKHGYSDEDIEKVMGGNAMRILGEVWA